MQFELLPWLKEVGSLYCATSSWVNDKPLPSMSQWILFDSFRVTWFWLEWAPFKHQTAQNYSYHPSLFSSTSLVLFMSGESSSIGPATPVNGLKLSKMKSLWVLHSATRVNLTLPCWLSHTGDPLIHHGWHFGRMVHAMCNVQVLIINGFLHVSEADSKVQKKTLTYEFVPELLSLSFTYILWVQG